MKLPLSATGTVFQELTTFAVRKVFNVKLAIVLFLEELESGSAVSFFSLDLDSQKTNTVLKHCQVGGLEVPSPFLNLFILSLCLLF